jgi:hypothetical protein
VTAQHEIIKDTSASLVALLRGELERNGYPRIEAIDQAPRPAAIEGKLPAISVYLYQLSIDPEGHDATPQSELVEVAQPDGTVKEFLRRRRLWVRLDYLISAWASTPQDEQLLLGLAIRTMMESVEIPRDQLCGDSFDDDFHLNLTLSARLDEGTLARFWSSLDQPIRPAVQVWTAVPIVPERSRSAGSRKKSSHATQPSGPRTDTRSCQPTRRSKRWPPVTCPRASTSKRSTAGPSRSRQSGRTRSGSSGSHARDPSTRPS